jgi:hypothetical protein
MFDRTDVAVLLCCCVAVLLCCCVAVLRVACCVLRVLGTESTRGDAPTFARTPRVSSDTPRQLARSNVQLVSTDITADGTKHNPI